MATDNTADLRADEDRARAILERIPAGRWGVADDLAGAVVFLASPPPTTSTGTCWPSTAAGSPADHHPSKEKHGHPQRLRARTRRHHDDH